MIDQSSLDSFKRKGYLIIKNAIEKDLLVNLEKTSEEVLINAKKIKWPYVRVYRDYPKIFSGINIFGIDFPLHANLNKDIYKLINSLNLNKLIKKISNFDNFETELIRLHTNSKFFNYQGGWHRDNDIYPSFDTLQCVIYLKDEEGFKVVTKDKNHLLEKFGIDNHYQSALSYNDSLINLPNDIYDVINAKAGDLLFFDPGLLHQGFCKKFRLHFLLRFKQTNGINKFNIDNNLNLIKKLLPAANLENEKITYEHSDKFIAKIKRFKTFLLYFFPRIKQILHNLKIKNKRLSIFHSTFWQ